MHVLRLTGGLDRSCSLRPVVFAGFALLASVPDDDAVIVFRDRPPGESRSTTLIPHRRPPAPRRLEPVGDDSDPARRLYHFDSIATMRLNVGHTTAGEV